MAPALTTGAEGITVSKMAQTKRTQLPVLAGHLREGRKGIRKEELRRDEKGPLASTRAEPPQEAGSGLEG